MIKQIRRNSEHEDNNRLMPTYIWLLSFLKPYILSLVILILMMAVKSGSELIVPKLIGYFVDYVIPTNDKGLFLIITFGLFLVLGLQIFALMIENSSKVQIQEKASRDLQYTIFTHLRKLGFPYFEKKPIGESLSLLNTEVTAIQSLYRESIPAFINGIVFASLSIGFMLETSWQLSLIVLPTLLLYYIFGPKIEKKASYYAKGLADARINEGRKVYESISALTELRVNGSEKWDMRKYQKYIDVVNIMHYRSKAYAFLRGTNRRITNNIGGIVVFIYGYYLFNHNQLSTGEFVSFMLLYFTTIHRLTTIVTNITEQRVLVYQAGTLYQFMKQQPEVIETNDPITLGKIKGNLSFRNICFHYEEQTPVLSHFTLDIPAGKRVALVGTSGNGKSTALKLTGRFYNPTSGEITLDGVPIQNLSLSNLRGYLGFVFQETYLFGGSVWENIRFGKPDASDEEVVNAAKTAYAHSFITELPDGYDTFVGERGLKLSGGQKQRIAIARMYLKNPSIILLDEATSALDNISETEVQLALDQLMTGRTILTVAHRLSTIKEYDLIGVLHKGSIKEIGTYDELLDRKQMFYALVHGEVKGAKIV